MTSPGELYIGQMVTVLEHIRMDEHIVDGEIVKIKTDERSGMGQHLEVIAIQLPYIKVKNHDSVLLDMTSTYDTRIVNFMELDSEFIDSKFQNNKLST